MTYINNILDEEQLQRMAFESQDDFWCDIDNEVTIYELINGSGYQQFVYDENDSKISFGIPLKIVDDLMKRYKSITGFDLKYHTGDLPINAQ